MHRIIVLRRGEDVRGLLVTGVDNVVRTEGSALRAVGSALGGARIAWALGDHEDRAYVLLEPDRLFSVDLRPEAAAPAARPEPEPKPVPVPVPVPDAAAPIAVEPPAPPRKPRKGRREDKA